LSIFDGVQSGSKANAASITWRIADDGRCTAIPERRNFQNGQYAAAATVDDIMNTYRGKDAPGIEIDRDLSRWLEAVAP